MAPTHIAFLRGINVGTRRVTNSELIAAFAAAGVADATAYQAAGNVMFTPTRDTDSLAVESALRDCLGFDVPTVVRAGDELRALLAEVPFGGDVMATSTGKPQVIFVKDPLSTPAQAEVEAVCSPGDRLLATATHVHWLPEGGVSGSKLRLADIDRLAGVATVRTRSTVERIAAKLA